MGQPEPKEVQAWNHFEFFPIVSLPCAVMNLLSLSSMMPETDLKSFWSLLGTKWSRPLWSCLKLQSPSKCPSIPLAQADLWPEEAALGRECCLFSHLPSSSPLAPSGPPSSPRLEAFRQIPKSCFTGLLAVPSCSGLWHGQSYSGGSWDLPTAPCPGGGGAPVPIASSCPTASQWWSLLVAVSPLEQQRWLAKCPPGPQATHIWATPTVAAPSAIPSLCPDILLQLLFLCSNGQRGQMSNSAPSACDRLGNGPPGSGNCPRAL